MAITDVYSLFQYFFWSRILKQGLKAKLFQKLTLPRLSQSFCGDQIFGLNRKVLKQILISYMR